MPYLTPAIVTDEELAMLKELKVKLKAASWKDLWVKLAQHYDGNPKHTLTKEEATNLIKDLESEKTEKGVIDTGEMEELKERVAVLEKTPKEASIKRMTKEDIVKHLETCTDPDCEYRAIAQAIREIDETKKPTEFLDVNGKHFTMSQIPEIKNMLREAENTTGAKIRIVYRQGAFESKPFKRYLAMDNVGSFNEWLKEVLKESLK